MVMIQILTTSPLFAFFKIQVPLSLDNWVTVLGWAAPIFIVDEVLKGVGRYLTAQKKLQPKFPTAQKVA
jgi:hypothetical protein